MFSLLQQVKKTIAKHEMLQPGDGVVVAVSGGPDSMALLRVLWELRSELRLSLYVAHLNHGLRPEAEEEKKFVQKAAGALSLPFYYQKADVLAWQKEKDIPLQEAAREVRYAFLNEVAQKQKANKIALGHTANDQVESIVMRFLRGSGSRGLAGIPPVREGIYIRPLIECWREQIEDFLQKKKISFLTDPSNRYLHYLRNRIRHELIPLLKMYNPNLPHTLWQMAEIFRAEEEYWEGLLQEKFSSFVRQQKKDALILDIPRLQEQPLAMQWRVIRQAIRNSLGHLRRISFIHVWDITRLMQAPEPNKTLLLPHGLRVIKAYQTLTLALHPEHVPSFNYQILGPGYIEIPEIGRALNLEITSRPSLNKETASNNIAYLDFDHLDFPLLIRSFRPGDRIQPLGMEKEKKLKDLFIDLKIPLRQRRLIPLLIKNGQILWVAGIRLDHRVRVKPETKRVLRVEIF
ncbi:MAG: tRNA lysidine(34) synthetase TilS [Thermodesulfobacteriota bacterium]